MYQLDIGTYEVIVQEGSHSEFNWAFTHQGRYEIDVQASGFLGSNGNGRFDEGIDQFTESGAVTYSFAVDTPNHAPANDVPGLVVTPFNTSVAFTGAAAVSVADGDQHPCPVQVSLTAGSGTLTLTNLAGLTFVQGDGTADAAMTFRGSLAAINASLATLRYTPNSGFSGNGTIVVTSNDLGYFFPDGADADSLPDNLAVVADVIAVQVNAPLPPPANNTPPPPPLLRQTRKGCLS